jgi:hypothetical protein
MHARIFQDYHMVDGEGVGVGKAAAMAVVRRRASAGQAREHSGVL